MASNKSYLDKKIDEFKAKVAEFENLFSFLERSKNFPAVRKNPKLLKEIKSSLSWGDKIKGVILKSWAKINSALKYIKSSVGMDGLDIDTGLGFVVSVPVAIAVGSIAASLAIIGKWIRDAYVIKAKITEANLLLNKGVPPTQVAAIINKIDPPMTLFNPKTLGFLIVGIGGFYLYKNFSKR